MKEKWMISIIVFMLISAIAIDFVSRILSMMLDGMFVCIAFGTGIMLYFHKLGQIKELKKEAKELQATIKNIKQLNKANSTK